MANGTVDFFNDTGGYGFIDTDDADDDVFFHMELAAPTSKRAKTSSLTSKSPRRARERQTSRACKAAPQPSGNERRGIDAIRFSGFLT